MCLCSDVSPLLEKRETLSRDCELGETPRWASQRCAPHPLLLPPPPGSLIQRPLLTALNKNFTSPSLRSLEPSSADSCTDLTSNTTMNPVRPLIEA